MAGNRFEFDWLCAFLSTACLCDVYGSLGEERQYPWTASCSFGVCRLGIFRCGDFRCDVHPDVSVADHVDFTLPGNSPEGGEKAGFQNQMLSASVGTCGAYRVPYPILLYYFPFFPRLGLLPVSFVGKEDKGIIFLCDYLCAGAGNGTFVLPVRIIPYLQGLSGHRGGQRIWKCIQYGRAASFLLWAV